MANRIHQFEREPFWRFVKRNGDSLPCDHGLEKVHIFMDLYMGLNDRTRDQIEAIYEYEFLDQPIEQGWNMFLWFAKDTYKKELPNSPPLDIPIAFTFDLVESIAPVIETLVDVSCDRDTLIEDEVDSMKSVLPCRVP
jgi:hypothetical protein